MYAHRGKKIPQTQLHCIHILFNYMYKFIMPVVSFLFFPSHTLVTPYLHTYICEASSSKKKKKKRLTTWASERSRGLNFSDGRDHLYLWDLTATNNFEEELYIFEQYKKWQVTTPLTRNDGDIHRWGKTRGGKNNRNNINVKRREMSYFALHRSAHARERESEGSAQQVNPPYFHFTNWSWSKFFFFPFCF